MKIKIIFLAIILLSFILRFYKLDTYPAINADEASNTYDAYSLIKTGLDQHGNLWPINFQSFNDYKPGLYVYLAIPFVKILGLNAWSARIPGALAGVFTVLVLYYFVKELFKNTKLALFAALFLAISPWHIHFSRGGWEVNLSTFLMLTGFTFLYKSLSNQKSGLKYLEIIFAALALTMSLYAYHAARIFVPLMGMGFVLINFRKILSDVKPFLVLIAITLVLLVPLAIDISKPEALSRAAGVGLFADKGPVSRVNEQRGEHPDINSITGKILHNKAVNYGLVFLNNWTTHFGGEFLFMSGDSIERNKVPETGQMYLFDLVFLVFGGLLFFKNFDHGKKFILLWIIVGPIASALTFQSPNALRSQNMAIPLIILSAFGVVKISDLLNKSKKPLKIFGYFLITLLIIWNFGRYLDMYWQYMSKVYPYSSQYGVGEMVNYVSGVEDKYQDIFVTARYDQPYILYLYYSKYNPMDFQKEHTLTSRDEYGFSTVPDIGKYHFGSIDIESIKKNFPKSLIVGTPEEIPPTENIIKKIYGTNGFEYFDIVSN